MNRFFHSVNVFWREFCEWHKGLTSQKHCITHFELNKSLWISYRLKYLLYTSRNIDIWSFLVCKNIGDFTRWIDIDNHLILASTVELTSYNVFDRFFLCRFSFTFIRPFFFCEASVCFCYSYGEQCCFSPQYFVSRPVS